MIFKAVLIILVCTHSFVMANECCCNPLSKQPKSPTVIYCDNRAPTQEMLISGNSREIAPENIRVIHESRATTANSQSSIYQQTCDSSTKISSSNFTVSTSLDQFSSTLEAPLCSILESLNGFSECKETLDDDCRNSLALAVEAIDIIQNLIMNRFAFSKLETDSFELTYSSFTIHDLIQQTIKIMSHKSRDRKLTLTYSVDSAVPVSLIGDEGRLRQILLNLVGNAIKFTENGGVKIGIKALPTNDDSTTLRFEIEDSGKGMTTEEMGKLFMPYVQANSSIVAQHGGTGLGLWISKRLCELMNGEIGVTSQLDRGSTFWFTATFNQEQAIKRSMKATSNKHSMRHTTDISAHFAHEIRNPLGAAIFSLQYVYERAILSPMSKPYLADALAGAETILSLLNGKLDTEKDKHIKRERTDTKTKSTVSTKIKILVVDDSPLQQKMITQMLKTLGFQDVKLAKNGTEALELASNIKSLFDIIFMDNYMGTGMDGKTTAQEIRKYEPYKIIPIVSLSGDELEQDKTIFDEYLQKPITKEGLILTFNRLFGGTTQAKLQ